MALTEYRFVILLVSRRDVMDADGEGKEERPPPVYDPEGIVMVVMSE